MDPTKNILKPKLKFIWINIIMLTYVHIQASYGIFLWVKGSPKSYTLIYGALNMITGLGVTAGAHRLWSHRSYKAKAPLRLLLVLLNTCVYQNSIISWCRNHRGHHKYSDTNADPHNVNRGFFFSHIGWTMVKKHPDVIQKGKGIDLSDLYNDPILKFQHKYYFILMPIACFILPTIVPMYYWQETFLNAYSINLLRYLLIVHAALTINSVAHRFGYKPYDKFIQPSDSYGLNSLTFGEGNHNYHHTFPWDYRSAEFGVFNFNVTKAFIDLFAKIGWAYDLKAASEEMVRSRVNRTGDGSHPVWGWGDKDQDRSDYKDANILYKEQGSEFVGDVSNTINKAVIN